ncbi:MAG: phospho-N-acetylmuramoyl-pentapeptide-transferase [Ruminococcus sp.]|nr:phospho-N-acetylmuramoyl-pentapeptide-transferase [Ruminococcus sp.]MCM1382249.1 phospho-N-acetylmuramoyl-pentapeptide-transferase [Muribaculaceae bacterium]MCM1478476.1 phospho-N-acetylmuramoyl-pentapeptide-transferase [Muribaculaceae bacterium]
MPFWINTVVALTAFAVSAVTGIFLIPLLKKIHFGQTIYEKGPAWHKSKQGTPMMGGFMFIIGTLIAAALGYALYRFGKANITAVPDNTGLYRLLAGLAFALLNGGIGFIDDYIKAVKKQNLGLKAKQKMIMQFILSAAFLYVLYLLGDRSTAITFPFFGDVDFGIVYYPIMVLYLIFLTNAVNLTDGIDGLCGSVTVIAALSFVMLCSAMGLWEYSIFSMALAGGCLGFLVWNLHPAKVFMGDTGSMFLGGSICAIGFATHRHLLLALVGIIYILEALSVVIQVCYFKATKGKRLFKMSPIHHHFELCGFSEYKIVITFSIAALIAGIAANLIYNLF